MSNVLVQTWLAHSVDVSLGVTHVAPNAALVMPASGVFESPEQAPSRNKHARRSRCIILTVHWIRSGSRLRPCIRCYCHFPVTSRPHLARAPASVEAATVTDVTCTPRSTRDRRGLLGQPLLRLAGLDRLHRDDLGQLSIDPDRTFQVPLHAGRGVAV